MIRRIMSNFASSSSSHLTDASDMEIDTTVSGDESPAASFGMTLHPNPFTGDEIMYGTMLRCRRVSMQSDGRSAVETVGTWRFKILSRSWVDGYMVAQIERYAVYDSRCIQALMPCTLRTVSATTHPMQRPCSILHSTKTPSHNPALQLQPLHQCQHHWQHLVLPYFHHRLFLNNILPCTTRVVLLDPPRYRARLRKCWSRGVSLSSSECGGEWLRGSREGWTRRTARCQTKIQLD